MSRTKGLLSISANFEPQIAEPFDARTRVPLKSDLTTASTWLANDNGTYVYQGITVSVYNDPVEDNNGVYFLKDVSDITDIDNWEKIGSGTPSISGDFVSKSGDTMTGTLEITGGSLIINQGDIQLNEATIQTSNFDNIDTNTILDDIPITSGNCAFWDILVHNGTDFRASRLTAVWNSAGTVVRFNETSTECIGDTSGIVFNVYFHTTNVRLKAQPTTGLWNIRFIKKIL